MTKLILIIVHLFFYFGNANAGESKFLKACLGISGFAECARPSSS